MKEMSFFVFLAIALRLAGAIQWGMLLYWARKKQKADTRSCLFQILAVAIAGYLLNAVVFIFPSLYYVGYFLLIPAFAVAPLIWLCTKAFFEDDFRFSKFHALTALAAVLLAFATTPVLPCSRPFYAWLAQFPQLQTAAAFLFHQVITLFFAVLSLYIVHKGRAADLVESRLRHRRLFIRTVCFAAIVVITAESVTKLDKSLWPYLDSLTSLMVFVIGYVLTQNLQHPESSILALPPPEPPSSRNSTSFSDRAAGDLRRLMEEEKVFLHADLNLERLAGLLKVPEYRLRRHINGVLGYQNFNQFLNHYRINEAKRVLSSPESARTPIYNLSVDLGYGSPVSFNRAFRENTGMTPTQFRESTGLGGENPLSILKIPNDFKN